MPFQSEKQRRYLWANEPEIARDWTDTYGSGIAKALGGKIKQYYEMQGGVKNYLGKQKMVKAPTKWQSGPDKPPTELAYITEAEKDLILKTDLHGSLRKGPNIGPSGIMSLDSFGDTGGGGASGGDTEAGGGAMEGRGFSGQGPGESGRDFDRRKANERAVLQMAERKQAKDLGYKERANIGSFQPGPKLGLIGGTAGPNIGNWASGFAGSKIGGGLGSIAFGPLGMILGSLFGRGVGQRAYQASQTDEEETLRDIMLGQNTLLSNIFSKKKTPTTTDEGLGGLAEARRLMTQSSQIPGANPLLQADPYQQTYLRNPNETFRLGSSTYESPKTSAKDFIDLSKSYSETDRIPSKYAGADLAKFAGSEYDLKTSLEKNPELHQQMNDAATKAQNEYVAKIQSGEIPFPDNLDFEMSKVGDKARHDIMKSQSDAPDIFSETLQEGLDRSNVQGKQKLSREQELLKEMGI